MAMLSSFDTKPSNSLSAKLLALEGCQGPGLERIVRVTDVPHRAQPWVMSSRSLDAAP
jgi:hypothetical protein